MKNKLIYLLAIMVIITVMGAIMIEMFHQKDDIETMKGKDKINIVTTIYPVYLIGLNLTDKVDNIEITSLINRNTGCLHDYQLTAADMKVIASADVLVINGGGMEAFLEDIAVNYPDLTIIDASKGISMLQDRGEVSDEGTIEKSNGEDEEYNSHVWLDPTLYEKQIDNVKDALINYIHTSPTFTKIEADSVSEQIKNNAGNYTKKIENVNVSIEEYKKSISSKLKYTNKQEKRVLGNYQEAVIFHEAFAYLANRIGMKIAFSVEIEPDTSLSAGNIADIVKEVKERNINYLFTEDQYSDEIPRQIAEETDSTVYVIDSIVTGDGSKDSYLTAMQNNLNVLKKATR